METATNCWKLGVQVANFVLCLSIFMEANAVVGKQTLRIGDLLTAYKLEFFG